MPSGVRNEDVEERQSGYCKHCDQPVVRIRYSGVAGKGDIKPFKHRYNKTKVNQEQCHRTTLSEDDVVDTNLWS